MRIGFFGEDAFSLIVLDSLINSGNEIMGVFVPIYDNLIYKRLFTYCKSKNISFQRLNDFEDKKFLDNLKDLDLDLIVVCHFQKILSKELINLPKLGSINLHPSLLPNYRGMSPQHWPIINGEFETGITIHFIDDGIDTGDIIIQHKIKIGKDTYVFELQNQMRKHYASTIKDAVSQIKNNTLKLVKQSHLKGSYYSKLKISECTLKKNMTCQDAYNLIRGVSFPYYGARFENYIIWKASIVDSNDYVNFESPQFSNDIFQYESVSYIKFCDGLLRIDKWEKL